jgi:hypothetical protein
VGASLHPARAMVNPLFHWAAVTDPESWRAFSSPKSVPNFSGISGANLFAGLIFSSIGFVGFIFGKRLNLWKPMFIGIALMAYPYFIEDTLTLCAIGAAGTAALFWARN